VFFIDSADDVTSSCFFHTNDDRMGCWLCLNKYKYGYRRTKYWYLSYKKMHMQTCTKYECQYAQGMKADMYKIQKWTCSKYRSAEELPMAAIVNGSGRNQQSL
jgi:hypothetical protein